LNCNIEKFKDNHTNLNFAIPYLVERSDIIIN